MMKMIKAQTKLLFLLFVVMTLLLTACDATNGCGGGDGSSGDLGVIESQYAQRGPYSTTSSAVTGFEIYYPSQMTGNHPIITWGNGTGTTPIGYMALLPHLASWGFVVIASNSTMTGSGAEMIEGIDYMIEQNNTPGSIFYGMLDTAHIGATGHSQGGGGAINAATDPRVTCSAPLAPSPGRAGQLNGPMLLFAGAQDTIVSPALVRMNYTLSNVPTIFAIQQDMGHMDFAFDGGGARGYMTAWFMYLLQDDANAAQAFTIGSGEIFANANWQVETKNY